MTGNSGAEALLKQYCEEGDQAAFNRFYRQQTGRLWRFLRARGCHEEAAYDLVAEAFTRFINSVCKAPSSPVALLYRIAVNLHIDSYRRASASPLVLDDQAVQSSSYPEPSAADRERMQLVRHYLARLPQDEQNLLLMRYWIGLTHKEIAGIVDLPEGTVRRQAAAAIKMIRSYWQQDET